MGVVYLGFDPMLDRQVAIKVLKVPDEETRRRFLREARLAARVHHPHIVSIYAVGEHEGNPYLAMEFIPGRTMAQVIRGGDQVPLARKVHWLSELCAGLGHAHESGIVHRDVKPSNLLVDDTGRVLIADLGSAKRLAEASGITVTTGTPAYMAPEQARGAPVDARCDVYSLGVVAYELVAGRTPYDGSAAALLDRPADSRPAPVGARDVPKSVDRVLSSALATGPRDRPATAMALADALDRVATGSSVRDVRRVRREVSPALVLVLALIVFGVSAAVTWFVVL
jgi:eukaryotic-like serine/threonine-protein kinase